MEIRQLIDLGKGNFSENILTDLEDWVIYLGTFQLTNHL